MHINARTNTSRRMHITLVMVVTLGGSGGGGRMARKVYGLLCNVSVFSKENIFICQSRGFGVRALHS